jgi:hypothetical protein
MPPAIPTTEPRIVTAGDTWQWTTREDSRFPTAEGFSYTYYLHQFDGGEKLTIPAPADSGQLTVALSADQTVGYPPGTYRWHLKAGAGDPRHSVRRGRLTILPDPATAATSEFQSFAAKTLPLVEEALTALAADQVAAYTINGRSFTMLDLKELRRWRAALTQQIRFERTGRFGQTIELVNRPTDG